jgi:hypothetical protein
MIGLPDDITMDGGDGGLGGGGFGGLLAHRPQSSSASRFTDGASGFFILSQSGERPERYGEPSRFDTMPSSPSLQTCRLSIAAGQRHYFCLPRPLLQKTLRICEMPHIGAATNMRPLLRQAQRRQRGMHMRSTSIAIAIVVSIGLIWSVAAMSKLVPLDGSEMRSAAISAHPE